MLSLWGESRRFRPIHEESRGPGSGQPCPCHLPSPPVFKRHVVEEWEGGRGRCLWRLNRTQVASVWGVCGARVSVQERPGRRAVLLGWIKRLQLLQSLIDAQVIRIFLASGAFEAVWHGVCSTIWLSSPEQVRISDWSWRASISDWLCR